MAGNTKVLKVIFDFYAKKCITALLCKISSLHIIIDHRPTSTIDGGMSMLSAMWSSMAVNTKILKVIFDFYAKNCTSIHNFRLLSSYFNNEHHQRWHVDVVEHVVTDDDEYRFF